MINDNNEFVPHSHDGETTINNQHTTSATIAIVTTNHAIRM